MGLKEEYKKKWKKGELVNIEQPFRENLKTVQVSSWENVLNRVNQTLSQPIQTKQLSPEMQSQINNLVAQSRQVNTSGMQRTNLATQMQIQNRNNTQPITKQENLKKDISEIDKNKKWYQKIVKTPESLQNNNKNLLEKAGDVSGSIGSTVLDTGLSVVKGVESVGQGLANLTAGLATPLVAGGTALYGKATGQEDKYNFTKGAKAWEKSIAENESVLDNVMKKVRQDSALGQTTEGALEGIGYTLASAELGEALNVGTAGKFNGNIKVGKLKLPLFSLLTGSGNALKEGFSKDDYKTWEVWLNSAGEGTIEGFAEGMYGMFGVGGNEITDSLKGKMMSACKTGLGKALANIGLSATFEGSEDLAGYLMNFGLHNGIGLLEQATGQGTGENWKESFNSEEMWENFWTSAISTILSFGTAEMANTDMRTAKVLNAKEQELGRDLTKKEIKDLSQKVLMQVETDVENNLLNKGIAKEINENINLTEEQKNYILEARETNLLSDNETKKMINDIEQMNLKQAENQATTTPNNEILNQEQQTIQQEGKQAQNQLSQETEGIEQKVLNLRQSIDNYNNSRQEGQEIFDINNEETRKEIEAIQKVVEDRNINIRFDENRFKDNSQNAFYEYDENGNVANIILNPNATTKKYVENLAIHELVHSFSGDKKANLMKDVVNYAKTLEGYDKAYQDIKSNYEKVYGKNVSEDVINEEVVANILGEKLGNKEFVNDLVNGKYSTQNRNFVQKIYDFVKNQINRFKGYKNQEQYWTHIKELFDDAYRNSEVSQEGIKASVERNITDNKQKQLDIIKESNPMTDEYHTGIRTIDDIKTFEEAIQDEESFVYGDYSKEDAERDLKNGTVTVYSSKPIEQGGFVSTSKNMAKDYAGNGQVYSQKVNINDVAWINGDEGQYAKIEQTSTKDSQGRELSKGQQEYFKNVSPELKDENGNLKRFYHGTNSDFTVFDLSKGGQSNSGASIGFWFTETKEGAEKFANDVWYGDKKPNTKEVYLDIKNPKIYENVKNEEQEQFYKDKSEELEKKAKELKKKYSWDNTDYKTAMTFDSLIRDYHYARIKNESVDLDMFERLAEGRGFSKEQISEMKNDATEYDKIIAESKEAKNEYYKLRYNDAYEQFKIDLYEVAGQSAEEANTGGLGMALNNPKETVEKFRQKLIAEGYDGIIIKRTQFDKGNFNGENNQYVIFNSNQAKNIDNTNPTTNPDIRYSQDTTGAWNNFIEKYFKNEGTGTAIKDMKKLPEMSITKYQEVLDNAKYIPQEDKQNLLSYLDDIKKNKSSLDDFKKIVNDLNNTYKQDNVLDTTETYSTGRKEKYQKYLNSKTDYDNSALKNALDIIPANNQGRRTKEQWLNVAKQIGTEIANKSNQEIEEIAFRTWQAERPSSKENLNRQGNKFVGFNSDEWVNAIYDSVNEQRQYSFDTEQQENVEQQNQQPVEQTVEEEKTTKKTLNPTEISNLKPEDASTTPELKDKKYKKGTKESNFAENIENDVGFLTEEQKKEILKDDNVKYYAPVTNADTLAKAYQDLKANGQNATLEWYSKDGKTSSAEDVAKGWILLKQYADKGDTQGMVNVAKKMRDMGTKAGQTVQAFNILSRLTPEGMVAYTQGELQDAYNEMVKGKTKKWIDEHKGDFDLSQEEVAFIMDTMQNLPAENPDTNNYERKVALGQIQKIFTDKIPAEGGKIKAWMRISMLFNPKTQVRNVAGNALVVPVNAFSDFLGSKVDKVVAKKTGVRTLGNPNAKSYLKGAGQGLYQSYNDFKLGINTRGIEGSKFEFGEGNSFNNKGLGKALNRTENILNFVMDAGDRAFSQGSFVNSLNNQMVLNGVDTPTQEMIDIATQEALSRTWNDDNEYTRFVLGIRNSLNKVGTKSYGLGDVLIPFAKTPANLTKAIVDYSPVGLVNAIKEGNNLKNAIETGQFTPMQQHKFVDDLGKALAGTMLYVIGYALAKAGIATGEADDDKDVKNFMKNSLGINSYSIKIGDKSFTYDWAQPVATPIAIMTNLNKVNKENPDASTLEKALNAVNIGTNQIMEQSFMESLNEVLNGNGEITERIQKALLDLPARAVPTFSKQIADLVDSTQRTSFEYGKPLQSSINAVKAKIPFASKTLTPVVDTLGNEVKRYGGENNLFNVFLNPSNMNKGQLSQAGKEIYNVYMQTGDTKVFPVTAPYYINYKGDKITMTSKQKADYQRIAGKYTEEVINKLLSNDSYNSLTDEEKAEVLTNVVNDSNSKAKKDVLNIENKNSNIDLIEKIGSNYYTFKVDLKNALDKKRQETGKETSNLSDSEKISVLRNENYSKKEKDLLYSNDIGKDDVVYDYMKLLNSNSLSFIDGYFDYKNSEKKVEELKEFLKNNKDLTYMQKLYLTSINNSSPDNTEREKLRNYINSLNITDKQKDEIKSKIRYVEKNDNGVYVWKTKKK